MKSILILFCYVTILTRDCKCDDVTFNPDVEDPTIYTILKYNYCDLHITVGLPIEGNDIVNVLINNETIWQREGNDILQSYLSFISEEHRVIEFIILTIKKPNGAEEILAFRCSPNNQYVLVDEISAFVYIKHYAKDRMTPRTFNHPNITFLAQLVRELEYEAQ